jgi:hypothetical protein
MNENFGWSGQAFDKRFDGYCKQARKEIAKSKRKDASTSSTPKRPFLMNCSLL